MKITILITAPNPEGTQSSNSKRKDLISMVLITLNLAFGERDSHREVF